ncbi:MAG: hypothetical protein KDD11_17145, partial [Acidobacteria bacterium]|nr:hypothetical protein [Acidobacteriota bacterium]
MPAYVRRRPYRSLDPEFQARSRRRRRLLLGLATVAAVGVGAVAWWTRPQPPPTAPVPSAEQAGAVAVLGWSPATGGPPSPWIGPVLSRMLATALEGAGVPRIVGGSEIARVTRETRTEEWRADQDLVPAARNLGVGRLLVGTYRENGTGPESLTLELRMVDAHGARLGVATTEAPVAELGPAVARLAREVVAASGTETDPTVRGETDALDYYPKSALILEPYARGCLELDRGLPASARAYLRIAALADSDSAEVQRALAEAWGMIGDRTKSVELGARALELGADLPERWRLQAEAELDRWRGDPAAAAELLARWRQDRPGDLDPALAELRLRLAASDTDG